MSERIDLTQFEGISEEHWVFYTQHDHMLQMMLMHLSNLLAYNPRAANASMLGIAALPKLLAELKRCYEELDRLNHAAHTCDDCGGHRESINDCENVCQC